MEAQQACLLAYQPRGARCESLIMLRGTTSRSVPTMLPPSTDTVLAFSPNHRSNVSTRLQFLQSLSDAVGSRPTLLLLDSATAHASVDFCAAAKHGFCERHCFSCVLGCSLSRLLIVVALLNSLAQARLHRESVVSHGCPVRSSHVTVFAHRGVVLGRHLFVHGCHQGR